MTETITIYDQEIRLTASMDWLMTYRRAFRVDALPVLFRQLPALVPALTGGELDTEQIDQIFILRAIWAMARTADPDTPDPEAWAGQWRLFPTGEILPELADLLYRSSIPTAQKQPSKSDSEKSDSEPASVDMVLANGIRRGLSRADIHEMTLSEWLDYIAGYDSLFAPQPDDDDEYREATQADFDRFKRM